MKLFQCDTPSNHSKKFKKMRLKFLSLAFLIICELSLNAQNRTMLAVQAEAVLDCELGLKDYVSEAQFSTIKNIANATVNTFTSAKSGFQGVGKYQRIVSLTGTTCKRANLLAELIKQTVDNYTVDLYIFGHGAPDVLLLNGESLTGGSGGNIRSLLSDARQQKGSTFNFKLRLVYMGDCFASSLNDDWLAIGAKVSVGSAHLDYMPEPMAYSFVKNFVTANKSVKDAANIAFNDAKTFWTASTRLAQLAGVQIAYLSNNDPKCDAWGSNTTKVQDCKDKTRIDQSRLVIAGNDDLIFDDQFQLALNQSKTFSVQANKPYTFTIYMTKGESFQFSASSSDTWTNCNGCLLGLQKNTDANGYAKGITDLPRQGSYNMMTLVGELFSKDEITAYKNIHFKIGTSRAYTATDNGYLNCFANDILTGYADNSGSISVTIRRTE